MQRISVIGAGAWGTALAQSLADADREVLLWAREPEVVASINEKSENTVFLPGVSLKPQITATESLTKAAEGDLILLVTPAQHVRNTLGSLKGNLAEGKPVVICAKGIELESGLLMSQVADEVVSTSASIAILTGPTFASEIARGLPSAVTIAARDKDVAQQIRDALASRTIRPYITDDMIGVQIGGAVKNVIAIASGIVAGRGLGESARAALITRGLAEMARLSAAMGGKKETLMGMCGVGDLILTATSMQSRNYSFGVALGEGRTMKEILRERRSVTEGVHTAEALMVIAQRNAVDMPVCAAVHKCLSEGCSIEDMVGDLMDRPLRPEVG